MFYLQYHLLIPHWLLALHYTQFMNFKTIHFYYNHFDDNSNNEIIRITHKQRTMPMNWLKTFVFTFVGTLGKMEVSDQYTASDGLITVHCSGPKYILLTPRYQNVLLHPKIIAVIQTTYNYDVWCYEVLWMVTIFKTSHLGSTLP